VAALARRPRRREMENPAMNYPCLTERDEKLPHPARSDK
jgi:hypothetical protein